MNNTLHMFNGFSASLHGESMWMWYSELAQRGPAAYKILGHLAV